MPYNNKFYLASAGAGKTTMICQYALQHPDQKVLLTTYTRENTRLLSSNLCMQNGFLPQNVTVMSWFSFLLCECIRPYQNFLYEERIENLHFVPCISAKCERRDNIEQYYFSDKTHIFSDKMSDFAWRCNEVSNGLVIKRLEQLFDVFILDEVQDIAGWDFDFIFLLLKSKIKVIMVGDVRQRTYSTTKSSKNKKYAQNIYLWYHDLENNGYGEVVVLNKSYRCIQPICDFADALFPDLPKTTSYNTDIINHMGLYAVLPTDLNKYCEMYSPQVLVYDKRAAKNVGSIATRNFGAVKGQTFERVLIVPTKNMENYLSTGNIEEITASREKIYVAITRAKFSVAFLTSRQVAMDNISLWKND